MNQLILVMVIIMGIFSGCSNAVEFDSSSDEASTLTRSPSMSFASTSTLGTQTVSSPNLTVLVRASKVSFRGSRERAGMKIGDLAFEGEIEAAR